MIQRIQTVYLLIVAALFIALMFLPLAVVISGGATFSFELIGLISPTQPTEIAFSTWPLMGLAFIITLISAVSIFLYKKRILQMRVCVYNTLIIIGFCVLFGFYLWQMGKSSVMQDMTFTIRIWASFPIISIILNYLAIRNIGADEALVRSLERLR